VYETTTGYLDLWRGNKMYSRLSGYLPTWLVFLIIVVHREFEPFQACLALYLVDIESFQR
jgi:hypothetical protein